MGACGRCGLGVRFSPWCAWPPFQSLTVLFLVPSLDLFAVVPIEPVYLGVGFPSGPRKGSEGKESIPSEKRQARVRHPRTSETGAGASYAGRWHVCFLLIGQQAGRAGGAKVRGQDTARAFRQGRPPGRPVRSSTTDGASGSRNGQGWSCLRRQFAASRPLRGPGLPARFAELPDQRRLKYRIRLSIVSKALLLLWKGVQVAGRFVSC